MNITVTRVIQADLRTDTWRFYAFVESNASRRGIVLMLSSYSIDHRPSKRHKMRHRIVWESYLSTAHTSQRPAVPQDVIEEARAALINSIIVEA